MLDNLLKFLKDHAKVAVTLALTGIGAVTLAYQKGCHVDFTPRAAPGAVRHSEPVIPS